MLRTVLLLALVAFCASVRAQSLIPFEFTSEDENRLISENDSFRYFVATDDSLHTVCLSEETSRYRLLNKWQKVIAEGNYIIEADKYLQDGIWHAYFGNGKVKMTGYFQKGLPIGTWEEYYSGGKLKKVSNYGIFIQDNEMHSCLSGTYLEYHPNGNLKANGFYYSTIMTAKDTTTLVDPVTGQEVIKIIKQTVLEATKGGHWEYFNENGELEKKEDL